MAYNPNRITIYQVAREAKVSLSTVSRVINNIGNVSEDKVKKVQDAVTKLGYIPSNIARGLVKSSTTNIAIVIPSSSYSYISSMMNGMNDVCKIYGYVPLLFTFENKEDAAKQILNVLSSQAEGIVIFNSELEAVDLHNILKINLPIVFIGSETYGDNALVYADYAEKLEECVSQFVNRGLKTIKYIKDPKKDWHLLNEFEQSIKKAVNNQTTFETISLNTSYLSVYDYFKESFMIKKPNHDLYIVDRDTVAIAIINAAKDANLKVPEDLEVMGIIGTKQSLMSRPMISSIKVDLYELGSIAMRMLTKKLNNTLDNNTFIFKTEYIKRESTLS